ncbi:hypothetical protein BHE74_00028546 [Ensete ventricosum]|nr:hypothetical protein BHE74_00028546 [Ensete ventricosum]
MHGSRAPSQGRGEGSVGCVSAWVGCVNVLMHGSRAPSSGWGRGVFLAAALLVRCSVRPFPTVVLFPNLPTGSPGEQLQSPSRSLPPTFSFPLHVRPLRVHPPPPRVHAFLEAISHEAVGTNTTRSRLLNLKASRAEIEQEREREREREV